MKRALIFLALYSQLGYASPDPIGLLTRRLGETHGLWRNGRYPRISLPSNASIHAVLDEAVEKVGFDEGRIERYTVVGARSVYLDTPPREYYAVLIDTNLGRKIVLMSYEDEATGWWTRFYDAE